MTETKIRKRPDNAWLEGTRTCELEGCEVEFRRRAAPGGEKKFCSPQHNSRHRWLTHPELWDKTRERRHHILPATTELVYIDYKEPLKRVEDGYGYYGTLATNVERTHVQCHICGELFKRMGTHLAKHNITSREYKLKFGLMLKTALLGEATRKLSMENYQKKFTEERKEQLRRIAHDINMGIKTGTRPRRQARGRDFQYALERRNKNGNCADQILDKIQKLAETLHRAPSHAEFVSEHGWGSLGSAIHHFGTWVKAVEKAGYTSRQEDRYLEPMRLLEQINEFRDRFGREPLYSDFKTSELLADPQTFYRRFGGIVEARKQADALKLGEGVAV